MKVVRNDCFGVFDLSNLALQRLSKITGKTSYQCDTKYSSPDKEVRTAPELVQVVEELGLRASGHNSCLVVVEVPDDVDWYIDDTDGWELIVEKHRTW